jgi:integrative and conjugative element protein (TIGR02256 family)
MTNGLLYCLEDGRMLLIRNHALNKFEKYRQLKSKDNEAGGILIGRILIENNNFIIDDITEPMDLDVRKRYYFKRSPEGHQEYFNRLWQDYGGHCFYLGEWHTHPECDPTPSPIDKKNWKSILSQNHESDTLFFVILGIGKVNMWSGDLNSKDIKALRKVNKND